MHIHHKARHGIWSKGFDQKCDLEIAKLKMLMALEPSIKATDEAQIEAEAVSQNSSVRIPCPSTFGDALLV